MTDYILCCGNCRFYDDGYCRIYPPRIIETAPGFIGHWPEVTDKDWCGKHEEALPVPLDCYGEKKDENTACLCCKTGLLIPMGENGYKCPVCGSTFPKSFIENRKA